MSYTSKSGPPNNIPGAGQQQPNMNLQKQANDMQQLLLQQQHQQQQHLMHQQQQQQQQQMPTNPLQAQTAANNLLLQAAASAQYQNQLQQTARFLQQHQQYYQFQQQAVAATHQAQHGQPQQQPTLPHHQPQQQHQPNSGGSSGLSASGTEPLALTNRQLSELSNRMAGTAATSANGNLTTNNNSNTNSPMPLSQSFLSLIQQQAQRFQTNAAATGNLGGIAGVGGSSASAVSAGVSGLTGNIVPSTGLGTGIHPILPQQNNASSVSISSSSSSSVSTTGAVLPQVNQATKQPVPSHVQADIAAFLESQTKKEAARKAALDLLLTSQADKVAADKNDKVMAAQDKPVAVTTAVLTNPALPSPQKQIQITTIPAVIPTVAATEAPLPPPPTSIPVPPPTPTKSQTTLTKPKTPSPAKEPTVSPLLSPPTSSSSSGSTSSSSFSSTGTSSSSSSSLSIETTFTSPTKVSPPKVGTAAAASPRTKQTPRKNSNPLKATSPAVTPPSPVVVKSVEAPKTTNASGNTTPRKSLVESANNTDTTPTKSKVEPSSSCTTTPTSTVEPSGSSTPNTDKVDIPKVVEPSQPPSIVAAPDPETSTSATKSTTAATAPPTESPKPLPSPDIIPVVASTPSKTSPVSESPVSTAVPIKSRPKQQQSEPKVLPQSAAKSTQKLDPPTTPSESESNKRHRSKTILYQSPTPELALVTKLSVSEANASSQKAIEDKLVLFYKGEFLAVRNAESGFFLCQTMQNVYKSSPRIRIRWLTDVKALPDVYELDFYDNTDLECVLTTLELGRAERNKFRLPAKERERIENILKRAIDVERGVLPRPDVTEENPDGLDLSLYKNESQIERKIPGTPTSDGTLRTPLKRKAASSNVSKSTSKKKSAKKNQKSRASLAAVSLKSPTGQRTRNAPAKRKHSDNAEDDDASEDEEDIDYKPSHKKAVDGAATAPARGSTESVPRTHPKRGQNSTPSTAVEATTTKLTQSSNRSSRAQRRTDTTPVVVENVQNENSDDDDDAPLATTKLKVTAKKTLPSKKGLLSKKGKQNGSVPDDKSSAPDLEKSKDNISTPSIKSANRSTTKLSGKSKSPASSSSLSLKKVSSTVAVTKPAASGRVTRTRH